MAQLGNDNFTRADNGSSWGTASDGQTWTKATGTATLAISSNTGTITAGPGSIVMLLGSQTSADGEVFVQAESSTTSDAFSAVLRCSADGTTSMYRASMSPSTSANNFIIVGVAASSVTTLAQTTISSSSGTFYMLRFRVIGSLLQAKVWQAGTVEPNTWTLSVTDTSVTGAGRFGCRAGITSGSATMTFQSVYIVDYLNDESAPLSDIAGGSLQRWPVDALTVADFPGGAMQSWPIDATTSTSTLFSGRTALPIESTTASSLLLGTSVPLPVEANTLSDIAGGSLQRWPVDALTGVSSPLEWDIYQPTEGLTVSETADMYSAPPPTEHTYPFTDQVTPTVLGGVMQRWPVELTTIVSRLLTNDELHTSTLDIYALRAFSGPIRITGTTGGNELTITELINFFSMKLPSEVVAIIMTTRDGLLTMTTRDAEISLTARNGESLSALTRDGIGATTKARDGLAGTIKTRG